jgi:hypothetical protein
MLAIVPGREEAASAIVRSNEGTGLIAHGFISGRRRTLAAPGDELAAVLNELARHLEELLGLVHCEDCVWVVEVVESVFECRSK